MAAKDRFYSKCLLSYQVIEIIRNPKRNKLEVRSMAESVVGKEEEERHQKLVTENEQLKKQVEEVHINLLYTNALFHLV